MDPEEGQGGHPNKTKDELSQEQGMMGHQYLVKWLLYIIIFWLFNEKQHWKAGSYE